MLNSTILNKLPASELEYQFLMSCFADYKNPRDAIRRLVQSGDLIRVKKGIYVLGPDHPKPPFSKEILANLVYGPSYISLDYALSWYGLIPERVEEVTSVTTGRNKTFDTPVGTFTYKYQPPEIYAVGMGQVQIDANRFALMAIPEKALADKMQQDTAPGSIPALHTYLMEDLRIDPSLLKKLRIGRLQRLQKARADLALAALITIVKQGAP